MFRVTNERILSTSLLLQFVILLFQNQKLSSANPPSHQSPPKLLHHQKCSNPLVPVDNDTTAMSLGAKFAKLNLNKESTPPAPAAAMALEAASNDNEKDWKSGLNLPQKDHRMKTAVSFSRLSEYFLTRDGVVPQA